MQSLGHQWIHKWTDRAAPLPRWRVTWGWRCVPPRSPAAGWPALWWTAVPRGSPSAWTLKHREWRETRRWASSSRQECFLILISAVCFFFLERSGRTYEVVVHCVLLVILRDGVFPIDDLQLGPLLEWVLLETQQVEDASESLSDKQRRKQ